MLPPADPRDSEADERDLREQAGGNGVHPGCFLQSGCGYRRYPNGVRPGERRSQPPAQPLTLRRQGRRRLVRGYQLSPLRAQVIQ